jgi:hypothetical protein
MWMVLELGIPVPIEAYRYWAAMRLSCFAFFARFLPTLREGGWSQESILVLVLSAAALVFFAQPLYSLDRRKASHRSAASRPYRL